MEELEKVFSVGDRIRVKNSPALCVPAYWRGKIGIVTFCTPTADLYTVNMDDPLPQISTLVFRAREMEAY